MEPVSGKQRGAQDYATGGRIDIRPWFTGQGKISMKLTLRLQRKTKDSEHRVEIDAPHPDVRGMVKCLIDGEPIQPDCIQIAPGAYSILLGGRSYEARIVPAGP